MDIITFRLMTNIHMAFIQIIMVMLNRYPFPPVDNRREDSSNLVQIVPIYIVVGFVVFFSVLVKRLAVEKANHSKELLKMMGMTDCVYWSSAFCNSFLFGAFLMFIVTIMYKIPLSNKMQVFNIVDFFLLLVVLLLYLASSILFYLLITTIFNRPNLAVCMVIIWHLLSHILLFVFIFLPDSHNTKFADLTPIQKYCLCLIPNGAIQAVFKIFASFEIPGVYEGWGSLSDYNVFNDFTLGGAMWMMLLSCFIYGLLIWYLDAVWPWQFGVPRPFYFPFTKSYWCGTADESGTLGNWTSSDEYFEGDPEGTTPGIVIKNLSKNFTVGFESKTAVDNVSLNIYSGQITALLGRNGAGKTTTINMLTGLFLPSSGSASINGYNIRTQTNQARASLGICPQHNILYETLTVAEHLKFYAALKGVKWGKLQEEVSTILKVLNLELKCNALSKTLSGGMKRKLSLGIALIGGSKVLFLDEPTSGMDPEARRSLWDTLLNIRTGRTIVLTTHYMEEADILGDRIAIMADGRVQCCGTPMFLKNKFGTGYHIHIAKTVNCDEDSITKLMQEYFPDTMLKSDRESSTLTYCFGDTSSSNLGPLFQELESQKSYLGISSFGVTVTTMDDVFLKVSELSDKALDNGPLNAGSAESVSMLMSPEDEQFFNKTEMISGYELWIQQLKSLFIKRFCYARRHWGILFAQILLPFALTCAFLGSLHLLLAFPKQKSLKLDLSAVYGNTKGTYSFQGGHKKFVENVYLPVLHASDVSTTYSDDPTAYALHMGIADMNEFQKKLSVGGITSLSNKDTLKVVAWYNGEPFHILPMALNMMHVALLRYFSGDNTLSMTITNSPLPTPDNDIISNNGYYMAISPLSCVFIPLILAFLSGCYVLVPIQECESRAKLLQMMTGISGFAYWLSMFLWDMLVHTAVSLLLLVPFAIFAGHVFFPHPEAIGSVILLLLLYGWSILPLCYLLSRHITKLATGYMLIVLFIIVTGLVSPIILYTVGMSDNKYQSKINTSADVLRLSPSFAVTWGFSNLLMISYKNVFCETIPKNILEANCKLSPNRGLNVFLPCCKDICGNVCFNKTYPITWDNHGCGKDMFYLWIDGVIFFALLLFLETGIPAKVFSRFRFMSEFRIPDVNAFLRERDSDVVQEENRVKSLDPSSSVEALVVQQMTKYYKSLCAVNGLSFGVHPEECFGLLGVNGAGKTSTFKMLTGDLLPTSGDALIRSISVQKDLKQFQSFIGYCPQFDPLIDRLTGREMLQLFACLRGISRRGLDDKVDSLINSVDLQEHANKQTRFYSGGTKRKLAIAISLIGSPSLILLDEPSAGVDPVSRRKIWGILEGIRRDSKSAIILCTHSMEECEALCSRLAIMVNGQFQCLGSIQHLKSKYGLGFTVIIKLQKEQSTNPEIKTSIQSHFQHTFPSSSLKDDNQSMLQFHITDASISWSYLFNSMESMKQTLQFEDYLISGTTLEQIFLGFARSQRVSASP